MDAPCISLIIPCYNVEDYVETCLNSVCGQTLKNIEAICIDDGATDGTGRILDRYRKKDARIRVCHQPNRGVAAARNRALEMATGEFVAFMDPDDFYPEPGTLELLYRKAKENDALICGGSFSNYQNETGKIRTYYTGDYAKYAFQKEGFVDYRDYQFDFGYQRFLFNRQFLRDNDLFFPLYIRFQDPPFFVRAMIAAERFYAVPQVVYRYRKGIQPSAATWPEPKLHDMMRGYLEDLTLSTQHRMAQLHGLTIRRFEEDSVRIPVMNSLRGGNEITARLLKDFNDRISADLLRESGMPVSKRRPYVLRHYRELTRSEAANRWLGKWEKLKTGIRVVVRDCLEFGPVHTLHVIREKLGL